MPPCVWQWGAHERWSKKRQSLLSRIRDLDAAIPADEQIRFAWEAQARKDPAWRSQARWARQAKTALLVCVCWLGFHWAGYRIVSSSDDNLAAEVRLAIPDPDKWTSAELRQRLAKRSQAVAMFEAAITLPAQDIGWLERMFAAPSARVNVGRSDVLVALADEMTALPAAQWPAVLSRLVIVAGHMDEPYVAETIKVIADMPPELRRAAVAGNGEMLRQFVMALHGVDVAKNASDAAARQFQNAQEQYERQKATVDAQQNALELQFKALMAQYYKFPDRQKRLQACYRNALAETK